MTNKMLKSFRRIRSSLTNLLIYFKNETMKCEREALCKKRSNRATFNETSQKFDSLSKTTLESTLHLRQRDTLKIHNHLHRSLMLSSEKSVKLQGNDFIIFQGHLNIGNEEFGVTLTGRQVSRLPSHQSIKYYWSTGIFCHKL